MKQALQRVVTGLSQNVSLRPQEVLLYVYGLISPFLEPPGASEDGMDVDGGQLFEEDSNSDESDEDLALGDATRAKAAAKNKKKHHHAHVVQWLPSTANLKLGANPILQKRQDAISQVSTGLPRQEGLVQLLADAPHVYVCVPALSLVCLLACSSRCGTAATLPS